MDSVKILGSQISLIDLSGIRDQLAFWMSAKDARCRMMVVSGFHGLWAAYNDPTIGNTLRSADMWVPDGIAPVAIARVRGFRQATRTPGMDIVRTYLSLANERGYSSFFYGDTEDTLKKLTENVQREYPNHRIAGTYSPPFRHLSEQEDNEIIERVNATHPDIVWVGLGMPKQDIWAYTHKDRLEAKAVIGVGAAFGFLAGKVKRCPDSLGNHGLEWAYRFIMEPKKLWRRNLVDAPRFLWHVGLELTGIKKNE